MEKIGEVIHFYDNISVAVLSLEADLAVGDSVTFKRGDEELFSQEVTSLEVDEESIEAVTAGDEVAMKVADETKAGTGVYR